MCSMIARPSSLTTSNGFSVRVRNGDASMCVAQARGLPPARGPPVRPRPCSGGSIVRPRSSVVASVASGPSPASGSAAGAGVGRGVVGVAGSPSRARSAPGTRARSRSRSSRSGARRPRSRRAPRATAARAPRRCRPRCRRCGAIDRVAVGDEAEHDRVQRDRCGCRTRRRAARVSKLGDARRGPSAAGSPALSAALASWIARTSFCVIAHRRRAGPSCSTYANVRSSATTRAERARPRAVDGAVAADDAGEEQLGDHLDDARAADAGDRRRPRPAPRSRARPTTRRRR